MAKKSTNLSMSRSSANRHLITPAFIAALSSILIIVLNKGLMFTDIRGFYAMHFSDGEHNWPFSYHVTQGIPGIQHPVEYPALTGLIMWIVSFGVPSNSETMEGLFKYFWITASLNGLLFTYTTHLLNRIAGWRLAVLFAISPPVLYSINRNWDIWAVLPMLLAIVFFDQKRYVASSILLAISIATKFFPIVILLPILLILHKARKTKIAINYCLQTTLIWLVINLPFVILDFRGWSYFYEFNFKRNLGSASIYEILNKLGLTDSVSMIAFYAANLLALILLLYFLIKLHKNPSIYEASFFTLFIFMLLNKQYSFQYIIWLTVLAVLAISKIPKQSQNFAFFLLVVWQICDFLFQYAYFQNSLSNAAKSGGQEIYPHISDFTYAVIGFIRYFMAILFCICLARLFVHLGETDSLPLKSKKSNSQIRGRIA